MALSNDELLAICTAEIQAASGVVSGELATERSTAMSYFMGEPYGDEVKGRSQVVTREVMETVEWIKPSLIRIFQDVENLARFEPVGPEDEAAAAQETDLVNHVFWKQNNGFLNVYTFCTDALLSKTGVLKIWYDESAVEEREEYQRLGDVELAQLLSDPEYDRTVDEYQQREDGSHDIVFMTRCRYGKVRIEPVAPEDFGVAADSRSPRAKDARFVYHSALKDWNELVGAGYDADTIESLPQEDRLYGSEEQARRNLSDEQSAFGNTLERSARRYWITECYFRADRDGDGVSELVKVTLGGRNHLGSLTLLDVEEVDRIPFATAPPHILTHKFYGLSIADLTMDLQQINSVLLRNVLDNAYLTNNQRTVANADRVNLDDLLTSRPGGVIRYTGEGAPNSYVQPLGHMPLAPETFALFEHLGQRLKQRTGVGDEVAGLDKTALAEVNTGVFALAFDAARMKIELIARILAEVGLKDVLLDIHALLRQHPNRGMTVKLRNEWVQVNPSEWRDRTDMTVTVGVGQVSKERRILALTNVVAQQSADAQAGGVGAFLLPQNLFASRADLAKAWGLEPSLYWTDPRQIPPKQGPDLNEQALMAQSQALMMDGQAKMDRNRVEMFKAATEERIKQAEFQVRTVEAQARNELDTLKARQISLTTQLDTAGKISDMRLQRDKQAVESRIAEVQAMLAHAKAERDREVDVYKIQMDAMTKLLSAHGMEVGDTDEQDRKRESDRADREAGQQQQAMMTKLLGEMLSSLTDLTVNLNAINLERGKPVEILRDARGLISAIGGKPVKRDASGKAVRIG